MSKEANKGEEESRYRRARHYHAPALTMDELCPALNIDDPYDLAHPSHVDPSADTPQPGISDFQRQLLWKKRSKAAFNPNVCPPTDHPTAIAPCLKCGHWPCHEEAGCPDYEILARGRFWISTERRFETDTEASENHTIGSRKC